MKTFQLNDKSFGEGFPSFIVAEMGLAHDGSLGAAHSFIDAAVDAGANAVKFQTHIADAESTKDEPFRVKIFPQDKTRYDYWRRTEFTEEQWAGLLKHCEDRGVVFLSTPFSIPAAQMLHRIGMKAWKISSGDTNNTPLLELIGSYRQPILLSTGMSYLSEIEKSVDLIRKFDIPLLLYQCTNRYPCPPELLGLRQIPVFREKFGVPVGLSDHSGKVAAGIAATTLGATSLEVHVTWDKRFFGPDVSSSLTFDEFRQLIEGVRFVEKSLNAAYSKDASAESLSEIRGLFTKSVVIARDLSKGAVLGVDDLVFKKPGTGIPAGDYSKVVGRKLKRELAEGAFLKLEDLAD
jgi:N,N'-diacetyllegionaminate synthase